MTVHPPAPLTAIAATPRKEPDNKFTFNPYPSTVSTYAISIQYIHVLRHVCVFVYGIAQMVVYCFPKESLCFLLKEVDTYSSMTRVMLCKHLYAYLFVVVFREKSDD